MQNSHPQYSFIHSFFNPFFHCHRCTRSWRLRVNKADMPRPLPPWGIQSWIKYLYEYSYVNNCDLCSEGKSLWAWRPCKWVGSPVPTGRTKKVFPKIRSEEWAAAERWSRRVGRRMLPTGGAAWASVPWWAGWWWLRNRKKPVQLGSKWGEKRGVGWEGRPEGGRGLFHEGLFTVRDLGLWVKALGLDLGTRWCHLPGFKNAAF